MKQRDVKAKDYMYIYINNESYREAAEKVAEKVKGELITKIDELSEEETYLGYDESGLYLAKGNNRMQGDFKKMIKRLKHNNLTHEMVVKAAKLKGEEAGSRLTLIDATAGMGEDSLLLAAAGFEVTLYEKDPVIAALLEDTIERAKGHKVTADVKEYESFESYEKGAKEAGDNLILKEAVSRMHLICADSIEAMNNLEGMAPDVILLDPMFPERQKTGLVKKKFQLIHQLEKPCEEEEALLKAAMGLKPKRIVIKRPLKGPFLAGKKPSYSLEGKVVRYDCIVN